MLINKALWHHIRKRGLFLQERFLWKFVDLPAPHHSTWSNGGIEDSKFPWSSVYLFFNHDIGMIQQKNSGNTYFERHPHGQIHCWHVAPTGNPPPPYILVLELRYYLHKYYLVIIGWRWAKESDTIWYGDAVMTWF